MNAKKSTEAKSLDRLHMVFGGGHAYVNNDINLLCDLIADVAPTLKTYESIAPHSTFYHRSASIEVQDLSLAATVCSPVAYEVSEDDHIYFFMPLHGKSHATTGKEHQISQSGANFYLTPGHSRKGFTGEVSMLQAALNPKRLQSTALTMFGPRFRKQIDDRLCNTHVLPMKVAHLHFDHLITNICKTIDDCALDANTLNAVGFDDIFYRAIVSIAFPDLLLQHADSSNDLSYQSSRQQLELVCEHVMANLDKTLSLTHLERIGDMSARGLQYAFKKRFQVSPTQWIREQRLLRARNMLQQKTPEETITAIAVALGFPSHSVFSKYYKDRFGELPSQTKRR